MNCMEARRELLTTPAALSRAARDHLAECDGCRRYGQQQAELNRKLEQAMRVPVPEHLGTAVIFERSSRNRRMRRWMAMAAAVVLMLTGVATVSLYGLQDRMPGEFVAHMQHDPIHEDSSWPQAEAALGKSMDRLGIRLTGYPGKLVAARTCEVGEHRASHFVVETGGVRATAFLMPGEFSSKDKFVEVEGRRGRLISTAQGVIAVFCPEARVLDRVSEALRDSIQWGAI